MRKQVLTIRVGPEEQIAVGDLAGALNRTASEVACRLLPRGGQWPAIFMDLGRIKGCDPLDVPELLMAEGLRRIMEISEFPLSRSRLVATPPGEIAATYIQWRDAVSSHLEIRGPLRNMYRLVQADDGYLPEPDPSWTLSPALPEMSLSEAFAALRSDDPRTRWAAALVMARNFAAGLREAGENIDDVQHVIAPEFLKLLERAVNGDASAVDALESTITADPKLARQTGPVREPAPKAGKPAKAKR